MNLTPRHSQLLELVRQHDALSIERLADALGVTLQTVRRDVTLLAQAQLLQRYHGGVRLPVSTT